MNGPSDGAAAAARRLGGRLLEVAAVQPGGAGVVGIGDALQTLPLRILLRTEQLLQEGTNPDLFQRFDKMV